MTQGHASAYLRQICCSGMSSDLAISEFLKALPMLIPSNSNTFSVCDRGLNSIYHLAGFDLGDMTSSVADIVADYHTPERLERVMHWFGRHPTLDDPRITDGEFYRSDMYHLIYRQFDMHHVVWAPVPLDGERTGIVALSRSKHRKPFDHRDQSLLLGLLPHLAHAYQAGRKLDLEPSPDGESGMLVMNVQGRILYQCPESKRLLELARYPRLLIDARKQDRLQRRLKELCGNLQAVYRGSAAPPPSFTHTGANGEFRFRASWLDPLHGEAEGLIGVTIEHRQPLTLKILRAMRNLPLSPTQREVALLLAKGISFEQIGQRLHVKPTTVKDHVGKIYTKLNIRQREERLPALLASDAETVG